jgi:hypothetical protein
MKSQREGHMMVFHGGPFQRGYGQVGYGLGSFFQSLVRKAIPLLQKGAKTVGKAALDTGVNVAKDVLAGNNLRDSAKARLQQKARTMKEQAWNEITSQVGSGTSKRRRGIKRRTPQKKFTYPQTSKAKRPKVSRVKEDIFGRWDGICTPSFHPMHEK